MVLYLALPHKYVDVNVHPSKTDVQLSNESLITMLIKQAVTNSLSSVYVARQSAIEPEKTSVTMPVFEKAQEYFPAQAQAFQSSLGDSLLNDGLAADAIEAEPAFESLQKQTLAALSHMSYIGCAFGLYALLESNEAIYVVDTHAAHERVLYEAYLDSYNSKSISSQPLLVPVMLNMPPSQYQAIVSCTDDFNSIGYEITDMGDGSIAVRSVPSALSSAAVDNLLYSLADDLSSSGLDGFGQTRSEALIKKACHSAVRGDANISESELRPLLKSLAEASVPFTCPHGRPIISTISMKSFMRAFERIN
jgi:DNA mismatch repair protein MutL